MFTVSYIIKICSEYNSELESQARETYIVHLSSGQVSWREGGMLPFTLPQQCDLASLERGHFHSRKGFIAVERKQKSQKENVRRILQGKYRKASWHIT